MLACRTVCSCAILSIALGLRRSSRRVGADENKLEAEEPLTLPVVSYIYVAAPNAADRSDNSLVKSILSSGPDSSCNAQGFQGSAEMYSSVSPECCDKSQWDKAGHAANTFPLNSSTTYNGVDYSCPVMALSPNQYVRGWAGCETDSSSAPIGAWAESCQPLSYTGSWPMPDAATANQNWERGTYESCGCHAKKVLGSGCYVGATFPGFAYFFSIDSSPCEATPSTESLALPQTSRGDSAEQTELEAPASSSFIQYYRVPNHDDIAAAMPQCNFWKPGDEGKKVADECCNVDAWPAIVGFGTGGPDARTVIGDDSGRTTRCYARERVPAPGTYVRNFFGCYQGHIMAAEGCAPPGTWMGHGYPLPNQAEAIAASEDGDPVSCGCDEPWYNQGPGCYVALSGFIAGVSPDPTANFLQVSGACSADR